MRFNEYKRALALFRRLCFNCMCSCLTLLHSERPKLYTILAFLNAIGLKAERAKQLLGK